MHNIVISKIQYYRPRKIRNTGNTLPNLYTIISRMEDFSIQTNGSYTSGLFMNNKTLKRKHYVQ